MNELAPLDIALCGHTLIEASAGTGKTYTITSLFLRLLLEKGLQVNDILIVTFTQAATEELKDRVRQRLTQALCCARGLACSDDYLNHLIKKSTSLYGGKKVRLSLERAIISLDEAAIFTIHGFCQRMLSDYAFETGTAFDIELAPSQEDLFLEAARQFWRQEFYGAEPWLAKGIISLFPGPEKMLETIRPLLGPVPVRIEPRADMKACLREKAALDEILLELKTMWTRDRDGIVSLLLTDKSLARRKALIKEKGVRDAAKGLDEFFNQDEIDIFALKNLGQTPFSYHFLSTCLKKGYAEPPYHPFLKKWDHLIGTYQEWWIYLKSALVSKAAAGVNQICKGIKDRQGLFTFDDLLTTMDKALSSPEGPALAATLRKRFKAALIDEFQDTDQIQYRIFKKIFPSAQKDLLIMIGDPKQSIYGFRGADIFTYLRAKAKVNKERRFGLAKNWRSSPGLVEAVNFLFTRRSHPFVFEDIPYDEVKSRDPRLPSLKDPVLSGDLIIWEPEKKRKKNMAAAVINQTKARAMLSDGCAAEIARLLAGGSRGRILIRDPSGESRPLRPGDIAILVRNCRHGQVVKDALSKAGISCVYHARQSVFSTDEAWEFLMILRAVSDPGDMPAVSTALATKAAGWSAEQIASLREHPEKWDDISSVFQELRSLWLSQGLLVMARQMIHKLGIAHRLIQLPGGERSLTNWFQLAELLEEKRPETSGIEAQISWLASQIELEGSDDEEQQLRLESDRELVTIMTIHRSKGLEFPVVFVPFTWDGGSSGNRQEFVRYFDEKHDCYVINTNRDEIEEFERQRLAEETRLLYVALTRAVVRCYISWGSFRGSERSALNFLLSGCKKSDLAICPSITITPIPEPVDSITRIDSEATLLYKVREVSRAVRQQFVVESFSSLSVEEHEGDTPAHDQQGSGPSETLKRDIFSFPKGPVPGNCIHKLLEDVDFYQDSGEIILEKCRKSLAEWGLEPVWDLALSEMVKNVINTQILPGIMLKDIPGQQLAKEVEFSSFLNTLPDAPGHLQKVLNRYESAVIRGFIDLLFTQNGRYYVADYKSNYLGDRLQDYSVDKLQEAMTAHNYHLQAEIYALALHRLLAKSLPGYSFSRHFGGVVYLFVRGIHPSSAGRTGVFFIPAEEIGKKLRLC